MKGKVQIWVTFLMMVCMLMGSVSVLAEAGVKLPDGHVLPKFDPPQKFSIFWRLNPKATATLVDYSEMTLFKEYKKRFGFDFEFVHPALGKETEVFNLMRASGEFPDFIYWENWTGMAGGPNAALKEGLAIPLNDLIAEHAPYFTVLLETKPELKKTFTTDDGTIYVFPLLRHEVITEQPSVWGFMVREDWLDKVGKTVADLATIEGIHDVLVAFRDGDPNGNGEKDEIPWMAKKMDELDNSLNWWGIKNDFYVDGTEIKYGPYEPVYKEAISTLAQWYSEGLIDPDYTITDVKIGDALMMDHKSGFYWGETGGISVMYMSSWKSTSPESKVVGVMPPAAADGKHYNEGMDPIYNSVGVSITKENKFPVESVKFLDWGYSPEGQIMQNFGFEGVTYDLVDGKPQLNKWVTENPDGLSIDQAIARHTLGSMQGPFVFHPNIRAQRMLFFDWQNQSIEAWKNSADLNVPRMTLTEEEFKRFSQIMGDIVTYRNESFDKFVTGQESLDNLDKFQETLKMMGIEEAIAIQQVAFDRYNAR